ncbi:PEP-CTERM sorting domain-containing protein [Pelotalea chapellei]|uniref:PEP-CTERM sorting domain-containing protein n=1 Tax=Pelotalea chapellei TaxID=44671 RepID=A0ABS5U8R2_9BACT|nr:PEP-CTERM sorting domain-containing protein [Pelotalea chapellei]MBT1072054.1 PEP-CTERM sorting domain-containing protein [Pelotalea chapellei]
MSGNLFSRFIVFYAIAFICSVSIASATTIDFSLNNLVREYQLGVGSSYYNPAFVNSQTINLGTPYTEIEQYSRKLSGTFLLPKYTNNQGSIVDGWLYGRLVIADASVYNQHIYSNFNLLHIDGLESTNYHYQNVFGTVTDFTVNQDINTDIYSFNLSQSMSSPTDPNWISGFSTGNILARMWFDVDGPTGYTLLENGFVDISNASVHFENASTPVPEPSTFFLLGILGGLLILYMHIKQQHY